MAAPISIVIPTLDAANTVPTCAAALFEGLFDGTVRELVVSDGGSQDETPGIAAALGAQVVTGPAGRGGQLRRGCAASTGPWILALHADTRLQPGWSAAVRRHIAETPEQAGYFWLRFDARGSAPAIVARWANLRSRLWGLPYGDQGLLVSRPLLDEIGGYPDQPLMEDVALARALRGRLRPLGHVAVTSADRYLAEGWFRRGARNLWCLMRYRLGAKPEVLARAYRRRS